MLIAIASDLHDNLANWASCQKYLQQQGISTLLFCGDLTSVSTLKKISQEFTGDIFMIAGNAELYTTADTNKIPRLHFLGRYGQTTIANQKIGLIHEPAYKPTLLREDPNLKYLFYGHTHKPWISHENGLIYANPGNLGGLIYPASFAVLNTDTNRLELKILSTL